MNYCAKFVIGGAFVSLGGYCAYQFKLGWDVRKKRDYYYDLDEKYEAERDPNKKNEYRQQLEEYEKELLGEDDDA